MASKSTSAAAHDSWLEWFCCEYLPALVSGGDGRDEAAIIGASAWSLAGAAASGGPGPGHSHVARIDFLGFHRAVTALLRDRMRAIHVGGMHPAHANTHASTWVAHGRHRTLLPAESPPSALITAEVMCTDPNSEAEWDSWYEREHVPDMMTADAFATATRWRRAEPQAIGCNDLTMYEARGLDSSEAVTRSAAIMPALINNGRKHRCHTGGHTMALDRVLMSEV